MRLKDEKACSENMMRHSEDERASPPISRALDAKRWQARKSSADESMRSLDEKACSDGEKMRCVDQNGVIAPLSLDDKGAINRSEVMICRSGGAR